MISERSFCLFWDSGADIKFQKYRKAENFKMETKIKDAETDFLFKAILSLDSLEECYAFFEDLCTVSEIKEMSKAGVLDPVLKTYLFAADRYIRTKIYEEDYNSKIILFDRYYQSALAYRMAENIDKNWVKNINRIFREPDMIFYIDITPQESIRRNTDTKFNIIEFE